MAVQASRVQHSDKRRCKPVCTDIVHNAAALSAAIFPSGQTRSELPNRLLHDSLNMMTGDSSLEIVSVSSFQSMLLAMSSSWLDCTRLKLQSSNTEEVRAVKRTGKTREKDKAFQRDLPAYLERQLFREYRLCHSVDATQGPRRSFRLFTEFLCSSWFSSSSNIKSIDTPWVDA